MPGDNEQQLILSFMGQVQDALKGITTLQQNLKGMEKSLADVGKEAGAVGVSIGQKFRDVGSVIQNASARIESSVGRLARRAIGFLGIGGLAGAIYKSVGAYQEFEQVVVRLNLRMGNQGAKAIKAYTDQMRQLSKQGGTSVAVLARGLEQVIASDVKGADSARGSMKLLEASNKAAIASMTDTGQMVDVVSAVMESYGMSVDDASKVTDTLFSTMRNGDISIESLLGGIKGITLLAAPMGIKFEEIGAAMAALTKGNLDAGSAFQALQLVLRAMIKPTTQMNALLKANGFTSMEAMVKAKGLTGVLEALQKVSHGSAFALGKFVQRAEGVKGISILAGSGLQDFKAALDATGKSAGITEQMYGQMSDTFERKTARFKAAMTDAFLKIGESVMPTVTDLLERMSTWVSKNGDEIAKFFKMAVDRIMEFGAYVIEYGPTIAIVLGTIWATGKLITWVDLMWKGVVAVKAVGTALSSIPAIASGVLAALLPIAAALSTIGVTLFALGKNKQAFEEGKKQAQAAREVYAELRKGVAGRIKERSFVKLGEYEAGSYWRRREEEIATEQWSAAHEGAAPTVVQARKIQQAVEKGIADAMAADETKQAISMFGEFSGQSVVEAMKSKDLQAAGREAFKKAAADGVTQGLTNPKAKAAAARAAAELARKYREALKLLGGLRDAAAKDEMTDFDRVWAEYEKRVDSILDARFQKEEDRIEALALANQIREQQLEDLRIKHFDDGMKRDAEIAEHRQKYEKEIEDLTKKALDDYFKARNEWEQKMQEKYPAAYAEFDVANTRVTEAGMPGALAGSGVMFGDLQDTFGEFADTAKKWLTDIAKTIGDSVADIGMDFAGVFMDLLKAPMQQLKQLLAQAIELAAEGKQYLILTNRERAEIEANIGRSMTEKEMRQAAEVVSPTELETMKREGRIGEYTVVGERTPEEAATGVLDKFIAFWENLAENLDDILGWIESTAFPRLINAIIKAVPKIITAIISFVKTTANTLAKNWLQKILDVVFEWIPKIIKGTMDSIKGFLHNLNVEKLINSITNFIVDLIVTIVKDIGDLIGNVIPDLVSKINHAIPSIISNLVEAIILELIPGIVEAFVDAVKDIFTGDNITGSKTWDGILSLFTGGISGTVGKYLHEGGMIGHNLMRSAKSLEGAIRAHHGMLVGGGLRPDEIPIIAQVGEAILNRGAVQAIGGPEAIMSINRVGMAGGQISGSRTQVVNQLYVNHMMSRDTARVIDDMQATMVRRRVGRLRRELNQGDIPGFVAAKK